MANAKGTAPKAIKAPLNRTSLIAHIVEETQLASKDVKAVLASVESAVVGSLSKKGAGEFTLPGLLKITTVKVPAKPKRRGVDPFTKVERDFPAKPASVKVKVRALKKLKEAAL